jgi:hypothetical protein
VINGAAIFGAAIVIICGLHPVIVEVIVTEEVTLGISIIAVAVTVPADDVMLALFGLLILIL